MQRKAVVQKDSNVESTSDGGADKFLCREKYQPDSSLLVHFQDNTLREYMRAANVSNSTLQTSPLLSHVDIFTTCAEVLCSPEEPGAPEKTEARQILEKYAANYWMAHFKHIIDIATSKKDGLEGETDTISAPDDLVVRVMQCFSIISSNKNDVVKVSLGVWTAGIGHLTKLTAPRNCYSMKQEYATMTSTRECLMISNSGHRRPSNARKICWIKR